MRPKDLPPRLVQSFLTVLRMQSYTKAAQSLDLTQPAVSQHISQLEDIVNMPLVERSRRVILPTKHAQALLPDFERFERSVGAIFEKARALNQEGNQTITIATPASLATYLLAPTIAKLREAGTNVFPIFREIDDHRVYDMVREGEVDFALTSMIGNDGALSSASLFSDRPCLVVPEGHPLNGEDPVDLDSILPFALVRPPPDTSASRMIDVLENEINAEFTYSSEASQLMTMEVLARANLGLLVLPALSARLCTHSGLRMRPINCDHSWRCCQMIRQIQPQPTAVAKSVMESVVKMTSNLKQDMPLLLSMSSLK